MEVHVGGPVETGRGFVLHSSDYHAEPIRRCRSTMGVSLTATIDILKAIAGGKGPDRAILALGYAGWRAGQLESEIQANGWLHCPADLDLLFDRDLEQKYERAMSKIGIDPLASRQRGRPRLTASAGRRASVRFASDAASGRGRLAVGVGDFRRRLAERDLRQGVRPAWPGSPRSPAADWRNPAAAVRWRRGPAVARARCAAGVPGSGGGPVRQAGAAVLGGSGGGAVLGCAGEESRRRGQPSVHASRSPAVETAAAMVPRAQAEAAAPSAMGVGGNVCKRRRGGLGRGRRLRGRASRRVEHPLQARWLRTERGVVLGAVAAGAVCAEAAAPLVAGGVCGLAAVRGGSAAADCGIVFVGAVLRHPLALAQQAAPLHAPLAAARDLHELQRLALVHGLAVVEALPVFAADRAQQADVILGLDALRPPPSCRARAPGPRPSAGSPIRCRSRRSPAGTSGRS